ncbi:MAG TPA: hypothetical protein VFL77_08670 [Solirubrobacterales bacterium]|nr:hypothetical protein [Solirubrobacterales bacterium]
MTQGEILVLLAIHLVLTGLPGAAAALFAASRGERRVPVLLAVGLAGSGTAAMLVFWSYYGSHELGQTVSFFLAFGSATACGWCLYDGGIETPLLRQLVTPLALWALGSAFLLYLGFLHGGSDQPLATASTRFSHPLPSDSSIPQFFSDWFYAHGHNGTPPVFPGEWLASDRPPLQVAYALFERTFGWDQNGLHYQVMGVVLQQLWIVGLWALLLAAGVGRLTRALLMVTVLVSGLAIVNGFFVWPKLLPAAMLLAAAALVLTPLWTELRKSLWGAALFAALCGLAMMGHGSSVFGVIPLCAIAAWRGMPGRRWLCVAALVGIAVVAPWSAYQKYGDPPGNRLVKWTLAGVVEIDDRSTTEAIRDAYSEAGFGGALHYKVENFRMMAGGAEAYEGLKSGLDSGSLNEIVGAIRSVIFYNLLPSLGLLLIAPIAMLIAWRRGQREPRDWNFALLCSAAFLIGAIAWGLLVIGSEADRTAIHVGSYLIPILGICAAVAGLRAAFPRFGACLLGLNAVLMLAIYVPSLEPLPGTVYSPLAGLLAAVSLAAFAAVSLRREPAPRTAAVAAAAE